MDSRGSRNYSNKTTKTIVKTQPNNKQYNNEPFNKNHSKTKPQNDTSNIILDLFLWIVEAVEIIQIKQPRQ